MFGTARASWPIRPSGRERTLGGMGQTRNVFVTGGTGYIGRRAIPALLAHGHVVRALVRPGSEAKLPSGCEPVRGNALDARTFASAIAPSDTLLQLVGT